MSSPIGTFGGRRGTSGRLAVLASAVALGAGCEPEPLPPFGEALLVVDTDLPVPRVVSRLRIDLHAEDATVFATRDDVRPDPRDWPTSFGVFTDDTTRGRSVLVRLRAYPEGRLDANGEPDPSLAIDRLVRVRLEPGRRGRLRVMLQGACVGIAAILDDGEPRSCVDGDPAVPAVDAALEDTLARDVPSEAGSWGAATCDGVETSAERVCVPGGAFVLGDRFYRPSSDTGPIDASPERVVRLSRFVVDRDEISVARYRDGIARGFVAPKPVGVTERDGAPSGRPDDACTYSASPRGREDHPLSCVPWVTADAFCRFEGGTLPTEAQWEYLALAAGRARKTTYVWGDDPPACDRAVFARSPLADDCIANGEGPQPVGSAAADVNPLGVRDLAGGLEEHTADSVALYGDPCWSAASRLDPSCTKPVTPECAADPASLECRVGGEFTHVTRGGGWASFPDRMRGIMRDAMQASTASELVGFRCVYPAP